MLQEIQFEEPEKEDRDLETRLEEFVDMLAKTIDTHEEASTFLLPIKLHLGKILEDPNSIDFESEAFAKTIGEIIDQLKQSTADREEIKPQTSAKPTKTVATEQKSQQKEKTAEQPPTMKSQPVSDPEPEDEKSEKIDPRKQKENQVLNLFIEFIEEADNDPNFKERVATICEMDEAYEYLGSIGLSQVYSFSSRGVDKKDDLLKLLKSWKRDGVPR